MNIKIVKEFIKVLKESLKRHCESETLLYTAFNRFLTDKYINFKNLKKVENYLRQKIPELYSKNIEASILKLKNISVPEEIFNDIEIFDYAFYYYNYDTSGFYKRTQFYTPNELAQKICFNINLKENYKILEPACGSGVFLRKLYEQSKIAEKNIKIEACEIDNRAVQLAKISFILNAYEKFGEEVFINVENKDFITDTFEKEYDCIIGNPPFIGRKYMPKEYGVFLKKYFPKGKENLAYGFLLKSLKFLKDNGSMVFILPDNFLYLENTKDLKSLLENKYKINIEKCRREFGYIEGAKISPSILYLKNEKPLIKKINKEENILKISDLAWVVTGIQTGNNKKYVKHYKDISQKERAKGIEQRNKKWYPYLKGGGYKKWSGNDEYFIFYENNGEELRKEKGSIIRNERFFDKEGITYSYYCENRFSARYKEKGTIFDIGGSCLFFNNEQDLYYTLAFLNSSVCYTLLLKRNPTMSIQTSTIKNLPLIIKNKISISELSKKAVSISKKIDKLFSDSKNYKRPHLLKYKDMSFEDSFNKTLNYYSNLKLKLEKINKETDENFEKIYGYKDVIKYTPKQENIKNVRKKILKDFFEFINVKNYNETEKYFMKKYPESYKKDLLNIARIINGKTFNDTETTINKMLNNKK